MKIAIIGTGISGLSAAYMLCGTHDITVFEQNNYCGGHSRTIDIDAGREKKQPVDSGFIVFNDRSYPLLLALFKHLNVPYEKSDMSFGVSIKQGWLEYSSKNMFTQMANFLRPAYWKMLFDILKFNRKAERYIQKDSSITLGQCLDELKMGEWFKNYYLLAMGAAIWSTPLMRMLDFPAKSYIGFFKNHGLLTVNNHPQWYTVTGGSRSYVEKLKAPFADKILKDAKVRCVRQKGAGYELVYGNGESQDFDQVVFACHADEAIEIIENPSADENDILGCFKYQDNSVVVHGDESFMPKRKGAWASWVYLSDDVKDEQPAVSLSYWMNNLQNFESEKPAIITLNPQRRPKEDLIQDDHVFAHPVFDQKAIDAQARISEIQGVRGLWFCGAYQRYGFHEDGLLSAVNMVKKMGVDVPWI